MDDPDGQGLAECTLIFALFAIAGSARSLCRDSERTATGGDHNSVHSLTGLGRTDWTLVSTNDGP